MKNTLIIVFLLFLSGQLFGQINNKYVVNAAKLNMRIGAGTNFEILQSLEKDDDVELIEKGSNGWWLVKAKEIEGYVSGQFLKLDPYGDWEKQNYQSGVTPECENVIPEYDNNIDNYLKVSVGYNTDAIVKLMKKGVYNDLCIRIVYVRAGDSFDMKNIPEGRYYLKIAYGKDYRKKMVDNLCYVKFVKDAQYEKGDRILDFYMKSKPDTREGNYTYKNWDIPVFELSLNVVKVKTENSKQFDANNISEREFNQ
jgi:hypothetical protein